MGAIEMLRSKVDFQGIQGQSRSQAHTALLMRYRRNELDRTRYGISTGRRVGNAVIRNKVRRRLRTILRKLDGRVERGWDILLVARPTAESVPQAELEMALERLLSLAGLLTRSTTGTN